MPRLLDEQRASEPQVERDHNVSARLYINIYTHLCKRPPWEYMCSYPLRLWSTLILGSYCRFCANKSNTNDGADLTSVIIDWSASAKPDNGIFSLSYDSGRRRTSRPLLPRLQFSTIHLPFSAVGTLKIDQNFFIRPVTNVIFRKSITIGRFSNLSRSLNSKY